MKIAIETWEEGCHAGVAIQRLRKTVDEWPNTPPNGVSVFWWATEKMALNALLCDLINAHEAYRAQPKTGP